LCGAGGGLANVIAETAGAHLVLTKPIESDDLIQAIEKVLGVGHAVDAASALAILAPYQTGAIDEPVSL
jgi:DNA-binding NarL/FixJ family response regulator